ERKADRAGDHEPAGDPFRRPEHGGKLRDALRECPHRTDVDRGGAPYVAMAEFRKDAALPRRPVLADHYVPRGSHRLQAGLQMNASVELQAARCKPGSGWDHPTKRRTLTCRSADFTDPGGRCS